MGIFRQFPYSNFHDMNMDEIIKIMREMQDEWTATKAEWASYKDFIDNYFANLDVSEEVLQALQTMAASGALNVLIDPVIAAAVAAWLADHITQPTTPAVDTSLTVAGAAADAKVTGDKIKNTEHSLIDYDIFSIYGLRADATSNGVDFTWNDHVCSVVGAAISGAIHNLVASTASLPSFFKRGKKYTIKLNRTDNNISGQVYLYKNGAIYRSLDINDELTFPILSDTTGIIIRLRVAQGLVVNGTVSPTITPYKSDNKNLIFDYNVLSKSPNYDSGTNGGLMYTFNGDSWTVNGTSTSNSYWNIITSQNNLPDFLKIGESYLFKFTSDVPDLAIEIFTYINGVMDSGRRYYDDFVYTVPENANGIIVRFYIANGTTLDHAYITPHMFRFVPYGTPNNAVKIANFGDSITWGRDGSADASTRTPFTITKYLCDFGADAYNFGVGGQGYFAVAGGYNALQKLQNTDITNYDVITLGWGTNDNSMPLGDITDTAYTSMLGALYQCWDYIRTQNKKCTVIVIAPPNASSFGTAANGYWYGYKRGPLHDYNLTELVEGMRDFCDKYKIPFIDNYTNGIDNGNITRVMPDGVHPNDDGYKIYSRYIARRIINSVY